MKKAASTCFDRPDEVRVFANGGVEPPTLGGGSVGRAGRATLEPPWPWSGSVWAVAETQKYDPPHDDAKRLPQ